MRGRSPLAPPFFRLLTGLLDISPGASKVLGGGGGLTSGVPIARQVAQLSIKSTRTYYTIIVIYLIFTPPHIELLKPLSIKSY